CVRTASAGAPNGYYPPTEPSSVTVPKPREFSASDRELISLFEQAIRVRREPNAPQAIEELAKIAGILDDRHPDAWLLRWNVLEILTMLGEHGDLTARLHAELEALERKFDEREPIATGLRHIRTLA